MIEDLCFEVIQTCPNNCEFCSSKSCSDSQNIIEYDLFKEVIEYIMKNGGLKEIPISGGEPFLHKDLLKMVSLCKSFGIKTNVYTSGIVKNNFDFSSVDLDKLDYSDRIIFQMMKNVTGTSIDKQLLRELKDVGLDKIVFDFQAADYDKYNELMGTKGYISYLLNSIVYSKAVGLFTEIHFIPMKTNHEQIEDIIEMCYIGEIDRMSILKFVPQGRGRENKEKLQMSNSELVSFLEKIEPLCNKYQKIYRREYPLDIRIGIPLIEKDRHLCTAGHNKLAIRYDGIVLPCVAFKEIDSDSLKKIFKDCGIDYITVSIRWQLDQLKFSLGSNQVPMCKRVYDSIENRYSIAKSI